MAVRSAVSRRSPNPRGGDPPAREPTPLSRLVEGVRVFSFQCPWTTQQRNPAHYLTEYYSARQVLEASEKTSVCQEQVLEVLQSGLSVTYAGGSILAEGLGSLPVEEVTNRGRCAGRQTAQLPRIKPESPL